MGTLYGFSYFFPRWGDLQVFWWWIETSSRRVRTGWSEGGEKRMSERFPSHCYPCASKSIIVQYVPGPTVRNDYFKQTRKWTGLVPKSSRRCVRLRRHALCTLPKSGLHGFTRWPASWGEIGTVLDDEVPWLSWGCWYIFNRREGQCVHWSYKYIYTHLYYLIYMYSLCLFIYIYLYHVGVPWSKHESWSSSPWNQPWWPGFPRAVPARFVPDLWGGLPMGTSYESTWRNEMCNYRYPWVTPDRCICSAGFSQFQHRTRSCPPMMRPKLPHI